MSARAELRQHPGEVAGALDQIVADLEQRTAQLAEAESQFRALIEQSLVGIYLTTYDRFVYLNEAALEMLGYPADELLGRRGPLDIVHPGDRAVVERNLQRRIAGELDAVRYSLRVVRWTAASSTWTCTADGCSAAAGPPCSASRSTSRSGGAIARSSSASGRPCSAASGLPRSASSWEAWRTS